MDYVPVFVANGLYKNRTEFIRRHVVYNNHAKYPKIDHYVEVGILNDHKRRLIVWMDYQKHTVSHDISVPVQYDKEAFSKVWADRWNIFENRPVKHIGELGYLIRKVVNSHPSRLEAIPDLLSKHQKLIVFYNFDYELELLRTLASDVTIAEWNGHKHEPIPETERWLYLVQYSAGAEAWNCIETNGLAFYSQNYSYKMMTQAAGRIDRQNTPYKDLYYYHLMSDSPIDRAIAKALRQKRNFNERRFLAA